MRRNKLKLAKEWLTKGKHDIETAQFLYDNNRPTDMIAVHTQQAIEKYLKGFLIYNGWILRKIHDLEELVTEAIKIDKTFSAFLDPCRVISRYYFEIRYPPEAEEYTKEEIKKSLGLAWEIVKKIDRVVK
ncbi:MAG: HEPN domain-containing protein [Candidatus Thermoplasmatota archaeon]